MRRLLRRLAWLLARLLFVLGLCFGVLSVATHSSRGDWKSDRIENLQLPRFVNPAPVDLTVRVARLLGQQKQGDISTISGELQRLGGATFPIILPRLAELPIDARLRVAWALVPVMQRMGWRGAMELKSPAAAAQFLDRAWQERSADFQHSIVTRWVQRLAQRANPELRASVIEYDSYALPALMAALPTITTAIDVQTAHRLTDVASRVTGLPWTVHGADTIDQAAVIVERWQCWWQLHASEYVVLSGPSRWSAMLSETQFGQWLTVASTFAFGTMRDGTPIHSVLGTAAIRTLTLLFATSLGAWLVTLLPKSLSASRYGSRVSSLVDSFGQGLFAIPTISVVAILATILPRYWPLLSAAIAVAIVATLADLGSHLSTTNGQSVTPSTPSNAIVVERRSRSPVLRLLRQWQFAGHSWPFSLLLVFVTERAFGISGLSYLSVVAFRQRDLHCLMAITTTTATCLLFVEFAVQSRRKNAGSRNTNLPGGK
jgi:hypothetical protein